MDNRQLSCVDRCNLATVDSANGFPAGACFRNAVHSAHVARLDLLGMFDSWTWCARCRTFGNLEYKRMCFGLGIIVGVFLPRSTSFSALGLPIVALHSYLVVRWCQLSTQMDELANGQHLFLFRVGEARF